MKTNFFVLGAIVVLCNVNTAGSLETAEAGKSQTNFLLSPNSQWLGYGIFSYNEQAEEVTQMMLCRPDGTEKRKLQTVPGHCDEVFWQGNNRLACSSMDSLCYSIVSVNGSQSADIKLPQGCDVLYKRMSPDGRYAAFVGNFQKNTKERQYGLFVVELPTGNVRCLIDKALKTAPAWSPDSRKIAIGNTAGYKQYYPLVIIDVESGQVTDTGIEGVGASWSPDGKSLAFSSKIVRGGSWWHGIPVDGQIAVYNPADKNLTFVTAPAIHHYDKETGKLECHGCLCPIWSVDGQWIAYWKTDEFRESKEAKPQKTKTIWIVKRDGQNPLKVADGFHRLAWSGDNQSLFVLKDTQIDRVDLKSLKTQTLASWEEAQSPQPKSEDTITIEEPGVIVNLTWIDEAYGRAFAKILSEARKTYESTFKFTSQPLQLEARRSPGEKLRLWTDGQSRLYLVINSKSQLAPANRSGVFNIYGMCHEIGHIAMYSRMKNIVGLPSGVGEGWAHYAGSAVVDEVAGKLGNNIWPEPYDVAATEGMARLKKQVEGKDWKELDDTDRAAKVFYEIEKRYGRKVIGQAFDKALAKKPGGSELMPLFVQSLKEITADPDAGNWIPREVLTPEIKWEVKERKADNSFFADAKTLNDETGVVLYYDDGTSENKRSMAGGGHAVLFQKPKGDWLVDRVDVFGSRYGEDEPPREDFTIYLCDEDFNVVHEFNRPYSLFEKGKDRWYKIDIDPAAVPERFYVCLSFNPTATKGVYVSYDESIAHSHSRAALPHTFVADVDGKYDWMIRVHLREVSQQKDRN